MSKKYFDLEGIKKTYGKSGSELARLLNISHSNMSRYENETGSIPMKYALELSDIFNFNITDFIKETATFHGSITSFAFKNNDVFYPAYIKIKAEITKLLMSQLKLIQTSGLNKVNQKYLFDLYFSYIRYFRSYFRIPTISIAGDFASGKTTFCNNLLGIDSKIGTGSKKSFDIPVIYSYLSEPAKAIIKVYNNNSTTLYLKEYIDLNNIELLEVDKLKCEPENASLIIEFLDSEPLKYFNLTDTPGMGKENGGIFSQCLYSSDLIIFFTSANNAALDKIESMAPFVTLSKDGTPYLLLASISSTVEEMSAVFDSVLGKEDDNSNSRYSLCLKNNDQNEYTEAYEAINNLLACFYKERMVYSSDFFKTSSINYLTNESGNKKVDKQLAEVAYKKIIDFWHEAHIAFMLESHEIIQDCFATWIRKDTLDSMAAKLSEKIADSEHYPYNTKQLYDFIYQLSIKFCNDTLYKIRVAKKSYFNKLHDFTKDLLKKYNNEVLNLMLHRFIDALESASRQEPFGLVNESDEMFWLYQELQPALIYQSEYYFEKKVSTVFHQLLKKNTEDISTFSRGLTNSKMRKINTALQNINVKEVKNCFSGFLNAQSSVISEILGNIEINYFVELDYEACNKYLEVLRDVHNDLTLLTSGKRGKYLRSK